MKKIVVIGGGTGTFVDLSGLKNYPVDLTAIVSISDSGGSSKMIRDEFGLLPPGDLRQSLVALNVGSSRSQKLLRELFMYRFDKGETVKGHTFGNLFLAALSDITGDQVSAIKAAGRILNIKGRVLPVSLGNTNLVAKYEQGLVVKGEHEIDEPKFNGKLHIKRLFLQPKAKIFEESDQAIRSADVVVIGPGDLYTSLLANITVSGVPEALQATKAKIIYVVNLMTKIGQTYGFKASDHVLEMEKYIGRQVDAVIINTGKFPASILKKYEKEDEFPVIDDLDNLNDRKIFRGNLLATEEIKKVSGDTLKRSLIRHDPSKLARVIIKLCYFYFPFSLMQLFQRNNALKKLESIIK